MVVKWALLLGFDCEIYGKHMWILNILMIGKGPNKCG
jgi:hypothetical protein